MKKLLMFLVLLTVSVGTWAAVSATQIQANDVNGKGYTYEQNGYAITTENADELATAVSNSTISDMTNGTYFTFSGKLNATDLAALTQFGANSSNDVYFDFSNATFVDENGDPLTDTSLLSNLNNAKAKYIILPNTTTSVSKSNFPSSVKEALAINGNNLYGYSSSDGGALEHVLAFDKRYATEGNTVTNYTLVGTYTYIQDPSTTGLNARGAATYSTSGLHNSVFGVIKRVGDRDYTSASIVNLDISGATFPNYSDEAKTYQATEGLSTWTGPTNGMELIHEYANSLTSIKLPETEGTTLIPYQALYNCTNVTALEIPGNIETLGMECFYSVTSATSITFNVGLKHMAPDVFLNCSSVTSIALPVGLEEIGEYAFIKCSSLDELIIPEGVKVIKAGAFEQTAIKSVRLPHTLKSIEKNAFRQCSQLQTMTFPENLEYIGEDAFKLCYGLTDVYFLGTTTIPEVHENAFDKECYANNGGLAGTEDNTSTPHTYGDYSTALIDSNTGTKKKVDLSTWVDYDANGVKVGGATVMHYPLVKTEAQYNAAAVDVAAYQAAQNVADPTDWYYEVSEGQYALLTGVPTSGTPYYIRNAIGGDLYSPVTTSQDGVTTYYTDDTGTTVATPYVNCNNGTSYFVENGTDDVFAGPVYEPQKVNDQWITSYYVKSNSDNTYTPSEMYFSNTVYHSPVTTENAPIYASRDNHFIQGVEHWYTDASASTETVITFPAGWGDVYYYANDDVSNDPVLTNTTIQGIAYYYRKGNDDNYYLWGRDKNGNVLNSDKVNNSDWYFSGSEYYLKGYGTKTDYSSTDHWIPTVTTYYSDENGTILHDENSTSWPGGCFKNVEGYQGGYYHKTGTTPHYDSACGVAYDASKTYYKDENGTKTAVTSVDFDNTYYVNNTTYTYTDVSASDVNQIVLKHKTYYDAEHNAVPASEMTTTGTYYEMTAPANEDVYGEYYTDPERNANYGGIYRGDPEDGYDKTHGLTTWPTFWDFGIWTNNGQQFSRTGLPTPDDQNRDGLKNFILVAGYPVEPTHDTPVVPVEHMDKDVWYTMCFPFDLTDKQLEDCFGSGYELAQFTDVTIDENGKYRLNFTTAIEADADGIMTHKHVPYMIHPNAHSFTLDDNGELVMTTTKFVLTDVIQTEDDYNMSPADMLTKAITATDPNGKVFTFVGYGHNYAMGETAQVVTPQYSFFLGTAAGETYPKYWRQTAANTRMSGSAWKKNTAIVLPPNSTLTYQDNRIIYDAAGTALDYVSSIDYSYINYVCPEYTVSAVGGSVKSMDIFFTNEPFIPNAIDDIIEKDVEKDSQIPAAYKNKIFNMSGQMVGTSPEGLEKGIYIMNGKKFIVR